MHGITDKLLPAVQAFQLDQKIEADNLAAADLEGQVRDGDKRARIAHVGSAEVLDGNRHVVLR